MTGSVDAFPLPLRPEEVTPEWLSAAFRTRYPEAEVTSFEVLDTLEGTATKLRTKITVSGAELPEIVWIKGGFADHRAHVGETGIYDGEVRFFTEFAPNYDLRIPACYLGLAQADPVQGIVVLEDLDDVVFNRSTSPLSVAETASGLEALAALHGQSWGDPGIAEAPEILGERSGEFFEYWFSDMESYFTQPRAFAGSVALLDVRRLRAAYDAYRRRVRAPEHCLLHGDAHVGNSYRVPDGGTRFVDWQTNARGRWFHDVNYFLVSSLDIPLRREHDEALLRHYLDALGAYPRAQVPSFDEAWLDYRCSSVYGFIAWLCNPNMWQPEDVNTAAFARFSAAATDYDTYGLLGA